MRAVLIVFLSLIVIGCTEVKTESISLNDDVDKLASDEFEGRETGTKGELLAATYISDRFKEIGLTPKGNDEYLQEFAFKPSSNPHQNPEILDATENDSLIKGRNVIGFLNNNSDKTVVIGAHYDHLGLGGEGSLHRGEQEIHNGADDNASGVAVLLKLATELKNKKFDSNFLFIAFSGEEKGLLGSNFFVKNPTIDLSQVHFMINMDMIGRLNKENTLAVYGVGTSPIFKQTLFANNTFDLNISENESGIGPSDHTSFYLADIPVLHFFTGQHSDYHKPGDDSEKLNYKGMGTISKYILSIIDDLDDSKKLAFKKTKNESEEVPAFKVGLGVVPDYLYNGIGMRIDGISEEKPAQKAGLKKGDIVVKLGEYEVKDMMGYMRALATFEKGMKTYVIVKRNGKKIEKEIEF